MGSQVWSPSLAHFSPASQENCDLFGGEGKTVKCREALAGLCSQACGIWHAWTLGKDFDGRLVGGAAICRDPVIRQHCGLNCVLPKTCSSPKFWYL